MHLIVTHPRHPTAARNDAPPPPANPIVMPGLDPGTHVAGPAASHPDDHGARRPVDARVKPGQAGGAHENLQLPAVFRKPSKFKSYWIVRHMVSRKYTIPDVQYMFVTPSFNPKGSQV